MRRAGAFIRSWGIGTAGSHPPPLGLVYKAAEMFMGLLTGKETPEEIEKGMGAGHEGRPRTRP